MLKRWVIVYKGMVAVREENRRGSLPNKGGLSLWGLWTLSSEEVGQETISWEAVITERWRVRLWCLQVSGIQKIKEVGDEKVLIGGT
jgi:hypothetical protein